MTTIRLLTPFDEPALRRVRRDALLLHPTAFGQTVEELADTAPAALIERMLTPPNFTFGGFTQDGSLVGIVGLRLETRARLRHRGTIVSVYVTAAQRGTGLARSLMEAALAHARDAGARMVELTVTVGNPARQLYADLGFRTYGIEPRGYCVDGVFRDKDLMVLDLD
jgi:ribosomal protein S18 acetylase RimI-like enzyme